MLFEEVFSAKTLEEAKFMAVDKFGVDEENIEFKVLEEPKKGLFGRLKGEFKVKATYAQPDVENLVETVEKPVESVEVAVENVEESKTVVEENIETESVAEVVESAPAPQETPVEEVSESVEVAESTEPTEVEAIAPVETKSDDVANGDETPSDEVLLEKAKIAQAYVSRILEKMDISTESEITQTENGVIIDFKGDGTGTIIGKRGETLDALQYLSAMICNKGESNYYRITLDSCGYRAKRKVILQELAKKVSKNVLRNGRSQALEPMNPYERRIIHSVISEIDGVSSRSVGEEPFRKVIISSDNPAPKNYGNRNRKGSYRGNGGNGGNYKRGGRNNGNNKYRGNGKKKNFQARSLDLKTSFEKDYRKPKPEDNLKEGLYGKIEL